MGLERSHDKDVCSVFCFFVPQKLQMPFWKQECPQRQQQPVMLDLEMSALAVGRVVKSEPVLSVNDCWRLTYVKNLWDAVGLTRM